MNLRKSVIAKKAVRYSFDALRFPYRCILSDDAYHAQPPILANSFPKSGTHLLIQILQAIPDIRDWGSFLASTPSFTFREIPEDKMCQKIRKIVPNELVSAHLYYSKSVEKALADKNVVHYFLYRDPRDIVVSETYYLTYMNKWHKLHKYFKKLPDMNARILFSIQGTTDPAFPYDYPDICQRFRNYQPWLASSDVHALKFEVLTQNEKFQSITWIISYYAQRNKAIDDESQLIQAAIDNIDPQNSHTYRKGKSGGWKDVFTKEHKDVFKKHAGELLIELGYEDDFDW
jgi:hypothetical protein